MKLAVLLLAALPAAAQNALWVDLSGEWRISTEDLPEFAQRDFDDRGWKPYLLPAAAFWRGFEPLWLRKSIDLPQNADTARLALTLGTFNYVYEVFVNGHRIGGTPGMSPKDYRISRPLTFDIPASVMEPGRPRLTIAIRSMRLKNVGPLSWGVVPAGPFLITYREHAPRQAGHLHVVERGFTWALYFAAGLLFLGVASVLLFTWSGERQRTDIFWFALTLALHGAVAAMRFLLLTESAMVGRWASLEMLLSSLASATLVCFAATAMGLWNRWLVPALGLACAVSLLNVQANDEVGIFGVANRLVCAFAVALVAAGWWRRGAWRQPIGQHVFAGLLISIAAMSLLQFGRFLGLSLAGRIRLGSFDMGSLVILLFVLASLLAAQIVRRVKQDTFERQRLASELESARIVQQFLLSKPSAAIDAVYEPAQEVGGDFYQSFALADGSLLLAVGDVSGKGLKAAMVVSLLAGALRNRKSDDPAALLRELNAVVADSLDGGFVTAAIARCHADGRVVLANAGNPAPYVAGAEVALDSGLPLGIDRDAEYPEHGLLLQPGERLTFVSDGVVEAENSRRELFGFDRTREISTKPAREIAEAAKAWGQNDDITVVTVRRQV